MNIQLLIQGTIEIALSLLTGLLIFLTSFKAFSILNKKFDETSELKKNNTAIAILVASFVFGIMIFMKSAIIPSIDTLEIIMKVKTVSAGLILSAVIRILVSYIIAAIFAFLILWYSIQFFMLLTTEIDEMEEIRHNNTAVAIMIGTLIISLTIILSDPLKTLLSGLVAPPSISPTLKQPLMNTAVIMQGLIELGISLLAAIFIFFFAFKVFNILTTKQIKEIEELKNNNIAIGILGASFVFSVMLLVRSALMPANQTLEFAMNQGLELSVVLFTIIRIIVFFLLSSAFGFLIIWLAMKMFMLFTTRIDEMAEIKNKNIAIAIIIATLVISTALLLEHGLTAFLSGLVKAPELGKGLIDLPRIN